MEANDQSKQQQLNEDDNRFEIPTDQSIQSKNVNEVIYSDGGIPSNNPNNTELFTTQSNDLDTRLKWAWSSQKSQIALSQLRENFIFISESIFGLLFILSSSFRHHRLLLKCHNKDYMPYTQQRGDFWVLKNYIRAEHGELKCHETITYTTHADYTFLDNLVPLLERWVLAQATTCVYIFIH